MVQSERRMDRIDQVLSQRQPDLTVVIENIHDPHNVSAILRTCDAAGVLQVELVYTREAFPRFGSKSSSSADKWLSYRKHTSMEQCCSTLHEEGYVVCATLITPESPTVYDLNLTGKTALVFGNEHRGVSDEAVRHADKLFRVPMMGMIQSLNVSVAAAVCLYEALRQRMSAGAYRDRKLDEMRYTHMRADWAKR